MLLDATSHLLLHRIRQQERDRHLGHVAALRAAPAAAVWTAPTNGATTPKLTSDVRTARPMAEATAS